MVQAIQVNEENFSKQFEPQQKKSARLILLTIIGMTIFFLLDKLVDGPWSWFVPIVMLVGIYLILQIKCPKCDRRLPLWWHFPLTSPIIYKRCPYCQVILNEKGKERG